jgi:hypothetical protein
MWRFGIATLCFFAMPATAAEDFTAMGVGTQTCGKFVELYRLSSSHAEIIYINWAQGFMTGMNIQRLASHVPTKNLKTVTTEVQQRQLRTYCDQHPLGDFMSGALELYLSLPDSDVP